MKRPQSELYWKIRYNEIMCKIQELHELDKWHTHPQPKYCISESNEFWVSNSLDVVDSEETAIEHFGEGNYFKVVKVETEKIEDLASAKACETIEQELCDELKGDVCPKCGRSVFALISGDTNDFTCGCKD